jgi:hypothetical protein
MYLSLVVLSKLSACVLLACDLVPEKYDSFYPDICVSCKVTGQNTRRMTVYMFMLHNLVLHFIFSIYIMRCGPKWYCIYVHVTKWSVTLYIYIITEVDQYDTGIFVNIKIYKVFPLIK